MPTIVPSSNAPSEPVHYSFAMAEFDLGGKIKTYKTDSADVISCASVHPWLEIQYEPQEIVKGAYIEQIAPKDDPMSGVGSLANDPKAAQADEDAKAAARADAESASAAQAAEAADLSTDKDSK
jgi:hypothetical protein